MAVATRVSRAIAALGKFVYIYIYIYIYIYSNQGIKNQGKGLITFLKFTNLF